MYHSDHVRRRGIKRLTPLAVPLAAALCTFACAPSSSSEVDGTAVAAVASDPYTFKNVQIGGGGYVPGIVFSQAQQGLAYARTDIGGMYRWNPATSSWIPLLDWLSWDNGNYAGVASVAADPVNANKVWAAVGMYTNDWDPNNGAILRSADKGDTWQISTLPFKIGGNMPGRGIG